MSYSCKLLIFDVIFSCRAVDEDEMDKDQILLQKEAEVRTCTQLQKTFFAKSCLDLFNNKCTVRLKNKLDDMFSFF